MEKNSPSNTFKNFNKPFSPNILDIETLIVSYGNSICTDFINRAKNQPKIFLAILFFSRDMHRFYILSEEKLKLTKKMKNRAK
jgi:hypothetical protein